MKQTIDASAVLRYDRPADKWTEALPLGNGELGAMVYGRVDRERIALNLDTLWSGKPYQESYAPEEYEAYRAAQQLVLKGEYAEAQQLLEKELLDLRNGQCYLPLGEMLIDYPSRGRCIAYERRLDLKSAVHTMEMKWQSVAGETPTAVRQECFVSAPDRCMVLHVETEAPMELQFSLLTPHRHESYVQNGVLIMDGCCPGTVNIERDSFDNEPGMGFRTVCAVKSDGHVRLSGSVITVNSQKTLTLILAAEDSFNGFDRDPVSEGKEYKNAALNRALAALEQDYEALRAAHVEDYSRYYGRVALDLGGSPAGEQTTDVRLIEHQKGAEDPALYALLFNYGRYLAISASRPGTQAMNLQGIWNDRLYAPWASNYTTNINTEMNYWPMMPCNLAELNQPLVEMVQELAVNGARTAQGVYHAPGWVCHHNSDLWRQTFPAKGQARWGFWPCGGAWLARHLFEQYRYEPDEAFLRGTVYPVIRGCAEFFLSQLVKDEDGKWIFAPGTSPENDFFLTDGEICTVTKSTAMTQSIIRDTFETACACAEILGCDEDFVRELTAALEELRGLHIGSDGRLMEWHEEHGEPEPEHRHVSHLFALYPARQIAPDTTPELAEACRRTLAVRGDNGTGWSLGWKINFWARLWDGDHALKLVDQQLRFVSEAENRRSGGGTYANMLDAHPPFQIDGNFGAVSGIAGMLLQESGSRLYLLPALPTAWKNGSVCGLRAPNRIEVSLWWSEGKLEKALLRSPVDQKVQLVIDGCECCAEISGGGYVWTRS